MKRFVLIDGSNMLFRAYYAIPAHLSTSSGQPTNAVFGFVTMLNKLLDRKKPDYAAVIFDPPGGSFRNRESADYKANRSRMPDDLASQIPLIDQVVEAFRMPVLRVTDFEADDVIATLAKQVEARGEQVLIVSSDKDFSQLLNQNVSMLDGMRDVTYTPELVKKKFGVLPERFVDFQALCGDKIDNIPGVPGIGKKTASKLLDQYESLDRILESADEIGGSVGKKLANHKDDALLSRKLAKLDTQVEHGVDLDTFNFEPPDNDALNGLFREMEFFSLLKSTGESQVAESTIDSLTILDQGAAIPQELRKKKLAVVPVGAALGHRFETAGLTLRDLQSGETVYLPQPWDASVREFFEHFEGQMVAHDMRELYRWCLHYGLKTPANAFDTRTASYLIDPAKGMPHDLVKLVKIHLHRVLKTTNDLLGKGRSRKRFDEIDTSEVAEYGAHLAKAMADLFELFVPELEEAGLTALAADEVRLSLVLAKMERTGIQVDKAGLEELSEEFRADLGKLQADIFALAGREFNIGSPKQLATVLFEELELPVIKRTKTGYSTNAEVLERLAVDHEIARLLLTYRKFEKLITTYVDVLLREIDSEDGRVHCRFNQTASTTGRLITSDPDLQRTPVRTDEGRRIRRLFKAPPGHKLLVADWSQVELRILAHLCGDPVLLKAFQQNADIHKRTASELFDKPEDEVTRDERDTAKTVNFATIYGQGASALAQNLEITKKEAQKIIERYFQVYSVVKDWIDQTMDEAQVLGKVLTIAGRTRFIPELFSKNFAVRQAGERMAVNTPVQGSAADICKRVMLKIDDEMRSKEHLKSRMLLQIHDELVFECPEDEVEEMRKLVTHEMENAWELKVPLLVSVGVGPSWEEAKD
jgi:DNA polymerase-1